MVTRRVVRPPGSIPNRVQNHFLILFSVGIRTTRGKPLVFVPKSAPAVEVLTGVEAVMVAFVSLFERPEFESFLGLLGYPIGFLLVLLSTKSTIILPAPWPLYLSSLAM